MQAAYTNLLRECADGLEDDKASEDLLIEYIRAHDIQAWFLREYVRNVDFEHYDEEVEVSMWLTKGGAPVPPVKVARSTKVRPFARIR